MEVGRKQVFIASVYGEGYEKIREIVKIAIKEIDSPITPLTEIDLTEGYASNDFPLDHCLNNVAKSEYMILIMGSKYGSIPKEESKSYTHLEYEHAIKLGIPVMVFCIHKMTQGKLSLELDENLQQWYKQLEIHAIDDSVDPSIKNEEYIKQQIKKALYEQFEEDKYKLPNEVYPLNSVISKASNTKYKAYLKSENLEYVSRKSYKQEFSISDRFLTEEDIYNKVFNDEWNGLLILGQGGVGKTRLMKELGTMAQKEQWEVLEINKDFKGWDSLILNPKKKYCFLFDYVEENQYFTTEILEILSRRYIDTKIKIIANTRSSYYDKPDLFEKINISAADEEKNYTKYVTKKILEQADQSAILKLDHFKQFIDKPAFATFLLQGLKDNKLDLNEIKEFPDYITKRLAKGVGENKFNNIKPIVFYILGALSFNKNDFEANDIVGKLDVDGWIEDDCENIKKSLHDTIYDELFVQYFNKPFFESPRNFYNEINEFLKYGKEHGGFNNIFNSFERISDRIRRIDWIDKLLDNYVDQITLIISQFLKSGMFNDYDKLEYIVKNNVIPLNDKNIGILLAKVMKSRNLTDEKRFYINDIYSQWASLNDEVFLDEDIGSYVITAYYDFFGKSEFIDSIAIQWICKFNYRVDADFVIRQYLNNGGNLDLIESEILLWCEKYQENLHFSFVLEAYLDNGGDINKVEKYILSWLNKNGYQDKASYIFKLYIKYPANLVNINEFIIKWLQKYYTHPSAEYLIKQYLSKSNANYIDQKSVFFLIKQYPYEINSKSLIKSLLRLGMPIESLEDDIIRWLNVHGQRSDALGLITLYLESNGSIEKMERYLCTWLESNKYDYNKHFNYIAEKMYEYRLCIDLLNSWIPKLIQKWLVNNNAIQNINNIINLYLRNCGNTDKIELDSIRYDIAELLAINDEHRDISEMIVVFLKLDGSIEKIETYICRWLESNHYNHNKHFTYIARKMYESGLSTDYLNRLLPILIQKWSVVNGAKRSFNNIINLYLLYGGTFNKIEKDIYNWIKKFCKSKEAFNVLKTYLINGGKFEDLEFSLKDNKDINEFLASCRNKSI